MNPKEKSPSDTEELFKLLIDAVNDYAIFVLDPSGVILTWNKGAQRLKKYSAHEIIGSHFSIFYTQEDIDRNHPENELKTAHMNGTYSEEGWRIRKDGSRFWAHVTITALFDQKGTHRGFAKVTRDLTERKLAEDNLKNINTNLELKVNERTNELQVSRDVERTAVRARDEFLSVASHELKTPITSLLLRNSLRLRRLEKTPDLSLSAVEMRKAYEEDQKQLRRLNTLIDDMLDINRLKLGKFKLNLEELDLLEVVSSAVNLNLPFLENIPFDFKSDLKSPVMMRLDRIRIEQVITNILTNAVRYGQEKPISISIIQSDGFVSVRFTDHGVGISQEDQEKVFLQFERVSNESAQGLGLGLYIAKQLIEAHHGEIELESKLGVGSTFILKFPYKN